MELLQQSMWSFFYYFISRKGRTGLFSYTTGRGVEGSMRLTVRLKNPDESFEPAVNIIPVPDAPGPKLDYDYENVSDDK
jgi:hypothetical protein